MEGSVDHEGDGLRSKLKKKTSAGSGLIARAGIVAAAQASGDADVTSPVHAFGAAELVSEADDLLASHMDFIRSREDQSRLSGQQAGISRRSASYQRSTEGEDPADLPIAFVAIVSFDLKQGPCLVCIEPAIEDPDGRPLGPLTPSDIHALRTDMPFMALPENGLAAAELLGSQRNGHQKRRAPWATPRGGASSASSLWGWTRNFGGGGSASGGQRMNAGESNAGNGDGDGDGGDGGGQLNSEATGRRRQQQHHDHALFMLRLGGENLFGMSHFLRVEDPSSPRGYTQGAAVCLSRLPFFALILQRLHSFSTDVIDRTACKVQLTEMALDLMETRFEELGHSAVYQDLPVTTMLLKLREKVLAVLRLVLLEGRVLFYSKSAAAASEAVLAMASLLPGTLPLGLGRLDPPGFGLKAYRWRKFGFPLKVFREDVPLQPLMVMAGASDVLSKSGFMAATTNSMVQAMPVAGLDFLVKVDTWELVSYKTERAKAALELGEEDRGFAREIVKATKLHLGDHVNDASQAVGWEGSSAWVADQFQMLFESMITKAASCLARNGRLEEERLRVEEEDEEKRKSFEEGSRKGFALDLLTGVVSPTLDGMGISKAWQQTASWLNGSTTVPVSAALEAHGQRWAELWIETENFGIWQSSHRLDLAAIAANSDPRTRAGSRDSLAPRRVGASGAAPSPAVKANKSLTTQPHSFSKTTSNMGVNGALALFGVPPGGLSFGGTLDGGPRAGGGLLAPLSGVQAFTYDCGDTYTGSWKRGRRHGIGLYEERATGNTYEGDWYEDVRHGRGVMTSGAKDFLYDGEWRDDKRTGQGNCVIRGRETYSGEWLEGLFHGRGVHCDAKGHVYNGEFVRGQREGAGKWTAKSGGQYIGEWKAGRRSGVGQSTEPDGTTYSGEWHDDMYAGEGTLVLPSGERYEGMFLGGDKHGAGSLFTTQGDTLEGEWSKSRPKEDDTKWRIRFVNKDVYAGTVLDGSPHGQGTYKYSNGDVFTGGWDRGLRSGHGICVFANGERFEGEWVADNISFHGKGALTLADGTTHDFT